MDKIEYESLKMKKELIALLKSNKELALSNIKSSGEGVFYVPLRHLGNVLSKPQDIALREIKDSFSSVNQELKDPVRLKIDIEKADKEQISLLNKYCI